jgi:chlorobactene glucosyltransferase
MTMFALAPTEIAWFIAFALIPVSTLGLAAFNLLVWPRGRDQATFDQSVSVLIPARNEEANIEQCVRAIYASEHPVQEVLVYEDRSTDATPKILRKLAREYPTLRIINGRPLKPGWVGKPHACRHLAEQSVGENLLFVDADTFLENSALNRLAWLQRTHDAAMVSALPRQLTGSFFERLVIPLLHLSYVCWLPLPLIWKSHDPRFLAVNGQLMLLRRDALERVGGFESVRHEVVDDMALARRFKQHRARVVFADGFDIATCRMYRSAREVWQGFSKNLYEGLGATAFALIAVMALYAIAFVLPYAAVAGLWSADHAFGAAWRAGLCGIGANLGLRVLLAVRFRQPLEGILLQPLAVLNLMAIALNSFRWHRRGALHWSGREYPAKHNRLPTTKK